MPKLKALIVDDEPLARELLRNFLADFVDIDILGECANGFEALKAIQDKKPGLVFLDVQMPKVDGFELIELLDNPPAIIFTTAFDEYALKAFEQNAVDYLLKPFSKDRLAKAIDKAKERLRLSPVPGTDIQNLKISLDYPEKTLSRIVVRQGYKIIVIPIEELHYLEAQDDYVLIYSEKGRFLKDKTMKYYEKHLGDDFVRIHRSHIIPLSQIETVEQFGKDSHIVVLKCGVKLRASATGYRTLKRKINF